MARSREAVGKPFDIEAMRFASAQSWRGVELMVEAFTPGMRESQAAVIALEILYGLGMEKIWHPLLVRFGRNTVKTFRQKSDGDPMLGDDDIFFIDIGSVFRGHEGDVGATFTTGANRQMKACADAAKSLFEDVRRCWQERHVAGIALYDFAAQRASDMGWLLNLNIKGHRVSDFPHAIYRAGALGAFEYPPTAGVWALEIQIADQSGAFGAFYEDVLIA